jgi:hypothetical protein
MSRTCVCFLTHRLDGVIGSRFETLLRASGGARDVYVVAERGTAVPDEYLPRSHFFEFAALRHRARTIIGDTLTPGNCHLRALSVLEAFPDYEHYWFVEYDVVYRGSWATFFASFDDEPADLLGAHVRRLASDPGWYWNATFDAGEERVDDEARRIAFLPIARMSRAALHAVGRAVERGWTGHFEMLVPTAVERAGLTIADLGGSSEWTPPRRRQRHYLSAASVWTSPPLSTLRFRPAFLGVLPRLPDILYHPDKGERASLAELRLAVRLWRQTIVGHPRKAAAYGRLTATRFLAAGAGGAARMWRGPVGRPVVTRRRGARRCR